MDPALLAAGVIAALTPYAKKAAEEFAGEVGKAVFEKTKSLMGWIKTKLGGDPTAAEVVKRFEDQPDRYGPLLEDVLRERLEANPGLADELSRLVEDLKKTGPAVSVVFKMKQAEEAVGLRVKKMTRGQAHVNLEIEEGRKITGADIEELG
ncbi:MAG TPA: hypothetical protein VL970_09615 [Candidatus Acidoferrales bacterium]|nr:hypothetical protein [Candidatus Acidoferrales bacterium]